VNEYIQVQSISTKGGTLTNTVWIWVDTKQSRVQSRVKREKAIWLTSITKIHEEHWSYFSRKPQQEHIAIRVCYWVFKIRDCFHRARSNLLLFSVANLNESILPSACATEYSMGPFSSCTLCEKFDMCKLDRRIDVFMWALAQKVLRWRSYIFFHYKQRTWMTWELSLIGRWH